jgi:hypothetical protein
MLTSILSGRRLSILLLLLGLAAPGFAIAEENYALHSFERRQLSKDYYSEGISSGDLNGDGHADVVYGPFWYAGPDFKTRKVVYGSLPQNRDAYANNFFSWVYDFNGDGLGDVLTAGFPGTPAFLYENPGVEKHGELWPKHQVFDWVSNESPHFTNLVGDDNPELVCTREGFFGYASPDWSKPFAPWTFHKISEKVAAERFGHGLGVGDIDGDGRFDLLTKDGWFEQPAALDDDPLWAFHKVPFTTRGGAEMHAYDVDGDGDNDVITSLAAHEFGLSWFEQTGVENGELVFKEHLIMGHRPDQNSYGIVFSELHSVALADMDGDGLKDIVTGKTYWSHHRKSPGWDAGAVVYWFRLTRDENGVEWIPYQADGEAGIGRQVVVADINADGFPDILTGGMKGGHVLTQKINKVDEATWKSAQPAHAAAESEDGNKPKPAPIDATTGRVPDALEGETLKASAISKGQLGSQEMANFKTGKWSGGAQAFWRSGEPGARLEIELSTPADGEYRLETVFTRARDYAIVQLHFDGRKLGSEVDLFDYPNVTTTGVVERGLGKLVKGKHTLTIEIVGANAHAVKTHFVGIDYIRLVPTIEK